MAMNDTTNNAANDKIREQITKHIEGVRAGSERKEHEIDKLWDTVRQKMQALLETEGLPPADSARIVHFIAANPRVCVAMGEFADLASQNYRRNIKRDLAALVLEAVM